MNRIAASWMVILFVSLSGASVKEPLPDGFYLKGLQVSLVDPCEGDWGAVQVEAPMTVSGYDIVPGTTWALLPSSALEGILKVSESENVQQWQLNGRHTAYRGQPYLYVERGLPLLAASESNEPSAAEPNGLSEVAKSIGIPAKLIQRIEARPTTRVASAYLPSATTDTVVVDRVGRLVQEKGQWLFRFEPLGRRQGREALPVLPCQTRELMEQMQAGDAQHLRFCIAALKTQYQGQSYLYLLRAVRVYSQGNLGS